MLPILELGSLEEDESMQSRWAALLANAADASYKTSIPPSFPEILKQLSPEEAKVLDKMYEYETNSASSSFFSRSGISADQLGLNLGIQIEETNFILDDLHRLGLFASPSGAEGDPMYSGRDIHPNYFDIYLTSIGFAFVKACRVPGIS